MSPERLFQLIAAGVGMVSIVGLSLLAAGHFSPRLALFGGLVLLCGLALFFSRAGEGASESGGGGRSRDWLWCSLLCLVALLFRPEPNPWISGTQDPGVYANFGAFLEEHPSVRHQAAVVSRARDDASRAALVRQIALTTFGDGEAGRYEGAYLPGVYLEEISSGRMVFQFYPLVPIWLAIAGDLFGTGAAGWCVTAFGVLSVLATFFLARNLSGSTGIGLAAALLLALNPLHAHFSRIPLSEVPAGFFLLCAAYGLHLGFRSREVVGKWAVGAGVLAFGLFCFTRVTGFLFLPVLFALLAYAHVVEATPPARRAAWLGFAGALGLYLLSVGYGWVYSYPYVRDIYALILPETLAGSWGWVGLGGILCGFIAVGLVIAVARARPSLAARCVFLTSPVLGVLVILVVVVHAFRIHSLATTPEVEGQVFVERFELAGQGWASVVHSSLLHLANHLSPVVALGFFVVIFSRHNASPAKDALLFGASAGVAVLALFQWVIPYHYYYARYLLGEALPLVLLFTVAFWPHRGNRPLRWIGGVGSAVAMIWCLYLVMPQWRFQGEREFARTLGELVRPVGQGDVLILLKDSSRARLHLPLEYALGRDVLALDERDLPRAVEMGVSLGYRDLWLLLGQRIDPGEDWVRADSVVVPRQEPPRTAWPARSELTHRVPLTLYRWAPERKRPPADTGFVIWGSTGANVRHRVVGLHEDRIWTAGSAVIRFPAAEGEAESLVLRLHGWTHGSLDFDTYVIALVLNGVRLEERARSRGKLEFVLPPRAIREGWNTLEINSETFVPAELGESSDTRRLGLDLKEIHLR
jgi:hypothetical protein